MKKIEKQIEKVEKALSDLEMRDIYLDINIDDIKDCIRTPDEYISTPSDLVDDWLFDVKNIRDEITVLCNALDKLQDLLLDKDL